MTTATAARHALPEPPVHEPPAAARAAGIVVGLTVLLAVIFCAFALPAAKSKPHDVPIGIVAPPAVGQQISAQLDGTAPGAFAATYFDDEAALRDAIADRQVYGGLAVGPQGPKLLIATGASPMVAQLLTGLGTGFAQQSGAQLVTEDLAPPLPDDPRGAGLAASALPLTLAGLLPAVALLTVLKREIWIRFTALIVFAGTASLTIAALLRYLFGSIDTNFWGVTAGLTLGALATGLALLGLGSLFGRPGLIAGAVVAVLVGNPLSGLNGAPELLPAGWGTLGQLLPQGANATLLRSTAFFDGAGAATPILVLSCWAAAGALLVLIAAVRGRG